MAVYRTFLYVRRATATMEFRIPSHEPALHDAHTSAATMVVPFHRNHIRSLAGLFHKRTEAWLSAGALHLSSAGLLPMGVSGLLPQLRSITKRCHVSKYRGQKGGEALTGVEPVRCAACHLPARGATQALARH